MDRRIGAQYFTLRNFCKTIEDFDETCRKVKEIGYQIIQISGTPLKAADMKPIIDKYGLEVMTSHRSFDDFKNNLDEIIDYNRTLGCKLCGVGAMPQDCWKSEENLTQFIQDVNEIAAKLKAQGLLFGYHNHAFEFGKLGGKRIMDRLIAETDPENVMFIVDTYWLQFGGVNPADFIKNLGNRAMAIHFKDYCINLEQGWGAAEMAEIGQGNLNWDAIIAACDEAGAQFALVEQDVCRHDPFVSMKMSYDYLTTKGFN